ncbi:hypothetical protein GCM10022235_65320 [Kribbella ginsengisoli]|uniref:DUF882 domain-containing protein n=1 Tax=Kribbella ginsengisoli TaxID=363865 RepID=A0ABP6YQR9_9ACTN
MFLTSTGSPSSWSFLSRPQLTRRGLLILGAGTLAGCSADKPSSSSTPAPTPPAPTPPGSSTTSSSPSPPASSISAPPSASTPSSPPASLPSVKPWTPGRGELVPEAKLTAVQAVQKLLARPNTVVEIIDAQYGGLLADTASVLVPCRTYSVANGKLTTAGTTVDVRLTRSGRTWRVTSQHPAQPGPPARTLTAAARHVLANDRIILPPASAADIRSGNIHDTVLTAMLTLAKTYRIGISVLRSGHPLNVFGTTRPSDHPRGRAFDTWQINGQAVVNPSTPRALITNYMRAAEALGSYNVGGPYRLSGPAYFSDRTHHDHVHAGFSG